MSRFEFRSATDGVIEISISDEGHLVETGQHDQRGHGLGLILAMNLLRADGGRVELVSTDPTTFVIRLPEQRGRMVLSRSSRSGPHLLAHEGVVGTGEQHDDTTDESRDLPPGQDEAVGQREGARQGL